ncbi:MAG: NADP-dependent glyceraldehyde-3-phosphate dehydrogenase [Flavobacterium sp. BFFFF1]|uniref:NADP-dependent glyceraldehyde-3-phosphate dehydrogenase n=1 Tax=Flavobacterium sp. BFFFF1 TaxID=2015557 RepID=UPI000BCBC596|nr:NADP-dependent glyceraldehyde-3-phosphate dehydrogenase [Flavobacterium sp. BFFFF1]OYU78965.1 MAG: NADP-dependent glyceraldehyde-3-phosphate dehydrogenase [Flavobacterium sp. BFFFF1]
MEAAQFEDHLNNLFVSEDSIPEAFRISEIHQREYLVNGEMKPWNGNVHQVFSPIYIRKQEGLKQKLIGSYPLATANEAQEALDAAVHAYRDGRGEWPVMSVAERIHCVEQFTGKMIGKKEIIVKLIMWEIGKSHADSVKEFDRTVEYIYATIDALKNLDRDSSRFEIVEGIAAQVRRSPLGVVLCMGPYNYPLNETFTTLIPALIMGNTILFKPPKFGTLLHYPLQQAFQESFPKGVVNLLYGRGNVIIPGLMQSGKINVLTLIGSSKVANELKKLHPKVNRLRAVLGLDAKNAAIVTSKADIPLAVKEVLTGSLSFNGQRCTALKIVWAHKSIADEFVSQFSAAVSELKFGLPWDAAVSLTPLPEPDKVEYLNGCIADAESKGAKVVNANGGRSVASFFFPAVVYPVNSDMRLYHEEQFGPIVPIVPFENAEEVIQYLIDTKYGQQVSIFTNDADELSELIDPLVNQVSRLNINTQSQRGPDVFPFTGRKDSAEGTLSVTDAIRSFSIRSLVAFKMTDENKKLINEVVNEDKSNFLSTKFIF